jgi:hypothetical protein
MYLIDNAAENPADKPLKTDSITAHDVTISGFNARFQSRLASPAESPSQPNRFGALDTSDVFTLRWYRVYIRLNPGGPDRACEEHQRPAAITAAPTTPE